MKIVIFILSSFLSFSIFAEEMDMKEIEAKRLEWTKKHFAAQGLPTPDGGVTIMPANKMANYKQFKQTRLKNMMDIRKFGYIRAEKPEVKTLLSIKSMSSKDLHWNSLNYGPDSEQLHRKLSEIKMAYNFIAVPENQVTRMIGYAPYTTYITDQGWAGIVQFFDKSGIGTCNFKENNIKLTHGSVIIPKEDARTDINGKATIVEVEGKQKNGFIYNVEWYDQNFFRQLECLNMAYDPSITQRVIELAKNIDSVSG